jgi:hypothetical protein
LNNIFISKTKSFYNYITSTHCKDFKDEWEEYSQTDNDYLLSRRVITFPGPGRLLKKRTKSAEELFSVLRNNEFIAIKNYIFRKYPEEERFENWVRVLKNFSEFVYNFADPLMININNNTIGVKKTGVENKTTLEYIYREYDKPIFEFNIIFEKSKIKSGSSTLFDTITGLDKENTLTFVKIEVTNLSTNTTYKYKYTEDSSLISEDDLDDEVCDIQLEMIKSKLDNSIYEYIGVVFDRIVNYELKDDSFSVYKGIENNNCIAYMYKGLEEKWLETTNMESD